MKRILCTILVPALFMGGVTLFLYPDISGWLSARHHSTAIQSYREAVDTLEQEALAREWEAAEKYNRQLTGQSIEDPFIPGSGAVISQEYAATLNRSGVMGTLEIPRIQVSLPIYHGTGEAVLQKGVGHLESTALPTGGGGNHTVLTGHRGLATARLFTDLNQLEEGDIFRLRVLDQTLEYRVDQILVVEPDDTEALRPVAGEDCVTLVTCTPYAINSHRLLVRGSRVADLFQDHGKAETDSPLFRWDTLSWMRAGAIGLALLFFGIQLIFFRRRRRGWRGGQWGE